MRERERERYRHMTVPQSKTFLYLNIHQTISQGGFNFTCVQHHRILGSLIPLLLYTRKDFTYLIVTQRDSHLEIDRRFSFLLSHKKTIWNSQCLFLFFCPPSFIDKFFSLTCYTPYWNSRGSPRWLKGDNLPSKKSFNSKIRIRIRFITREEENAVWKKD